MMAVAAVAVVVPISVVADFETFNGAAIFLLKKGLLERCS